MCLIIVSKEGKKAEESIIKSANTSNPHGIGIMYINKGRVHINKDFRSVTSFLKWYRQSLPNVPHAIHFRYATSGEVNKGMRHPFPVTDNRKAIKATNVSCDMAVAHNGIIQKYSYPKAELSDTAKFVVDVLARKDIRNNITCPDVYAEVNGFVLGSRLVVFQSNGNMLFWGSWEEDKETGLLFSNGTYKYRELRYIDYDTDIYSNYGYPYAVEKSSGKLSHKAELGKFNDFCDSCNKYKELQAIWDSGTYWYLCPECLEVFEGDKL